MLWSEPDTEQSIDARFRQVAPTAGRPALAGTGAGLSYPDLDELAARYAGAMLAFGERPRRIALLLDHGPDVVAAALAALRTGAAAVTLDPGNPPARIAAIRETTDPDLVVTTATHEGLARAAGFDAGHTLELATAAAADPVVTPSPAGPDDVAFLISTSGSTGVPKVVIQTHRNVLHNVLRYTNGLGIREDDRLALLAALSGGQGLVTTMTALLNGATLCPFPVGQRGVTGLADWLESTGVTVFDTIPSVLRNFARALHGRRLKEIRLVRLASEPALRGDFEAFATHFGRDSRLASVLASSECGIVAQAILAPDAVLEDERLPVGYPAEGVEAAIEGADGEIVVRSRYLSPGYWGDERLTAERFETVEGTRQFRSGDLGRLDADGMLTVVGRADAQVKIRGHRLQLEEVEAALAEQPGVTAAVVVPTTTSRRDTKLTAFLTAAPRHETSPEELRAALQQRLPAHAIPASFVWLDSLPVTAHGKIDRDRLAAFQPVEEPTEPDALSQTEEILQRMWRDALGRENVGREDGFLDLGGDSLDAASIAAGIHQVFNLEVDLRDFAANPTLGALADAIDRGALTSPDPADVPVRRARRPGPLSFAQLRFFRRERQSSSASVWNVAVPFRIHGALDVDVFRRSVEALVRRHEILRTGYVERDDRRWAIVRGPQPVELPIDDLRPRSDRERVAEEIAERERLTPFDLEHGPLLRLRLLRLADDEYRLLRVTHHMIHDAASWPILFQELAREYEALLGGGASTLSEPPGFQYIDYAAWERQSLRPETSRYQEEVAWWAERYADAPDPPELPFARAEPLEEAQGVDVVRWGIGPEEAAQLAATGRAAGATYYMTRLAAFAAILALETGVDDLLVGTALNARTRPEFQAMVGPFINFRALRLALPGNATFAELLADVRTAVLDMSRRSHIPWEPLTRELRGRGVRAKPVAASFAAWNSVTKLRFAGVELEALPRPCGDSPGFRVGVNRHYDADRCWADFDPSRYDVGGVAAFVGRLEAFLGAVAAEPSRPVHQLHENLVPPAAHR